MATKPPSMVPSLLEKISHRVPGECYRVLLDLAVKYKELFKRRPDSFIQGGIVHLLVYRSPYSIGQVPGLVYIEDYTKEGEKIESPLLNLSSITLNIRGGKIPLNGCGDVVCMAPQTPFTITFKSGVKRFKMAVVPRSLLMLTGEARYLFSGKISKRGGEKSLVLFC